MHKIALIDMMYSPSSTDDDDLVSIPLDSLTSHGGNKMTGGSILTFLTPKKPKKDKKPERDLVHVSYGAKSVASMNDNMHSIPHASVCMMRAHVCVYMSIHMQCM